MNLVSRAYDYAFLLPKTEHVSKDDYAGGKSSAPVIKLSQPFFEETPSPFFFFEISTTRGKDSQAVAKKHVQGCLTSRIYFLPRFEPRLSPHVWRLYWVLCALCNTCHAHEDRLVSSSKRTNVVTRFFVKWLKPFDRYFIHAWNSAWYIC